MNKIAISIVLTFFTLSAFSQEHNLGAEKEAVSAACTAEAAAANCGDQKVGSGLVKCIRGYKKSHKNFKVSEGCKQAMKSLKAKKHEKKKSKKNKTH